MASLSANLKHIISLWIDLERVLYARRPKNLKLEAFCKEEWEKIPQTRTERLFAATDSIDKL